MGSLLPAEERHEVVQQLLTSMVGWGRVSTELARLRDEATARLVAKDDERLRGRIQALNELILLPVTLSEEMAALSRNLRDAADEESGITADDEGSPLID